MSHLSGDVLNLYLDDELASGERGAAEAHLRGCPDCRRELNALRGLSARLAGLPLEPLPLDLAPLVLRRIESPRPGWADRVGAGLLVGQVIAVALVAAWYLTQSSQPDVLGPGWFWLAQPVTFFLPWIDSLVAGFAPSLPDVGGEIPTGIAMENLQVGGIIVLLLGALWVVSNRMLLADGRNARRGEQGRS